MAHYCKTLDRPHYWYTYIYSQRTNPLHENPSDAKLSLWVYNSILRNKRRNPLFGCDVPSSIGT